jgi:hypothetical protein
VLQELAAKLEELRNAHKLEMADVVRSVCAIIEMRAVDILIATC